MCWPAFFLLRVVCPMMSKEAERSSASRGTMRSFLVAMEITLTANTLYDAQSGLVNWCSHTKFRTKFWESISCFDCPFSHSIIIPQHIDICCLLNTWHEASLTSVYASERFTKRLSWWFVVHSWTGRICDQPERDFFCFSRRASCFFKLSMVSSWVQGLGFVTEKCKDWSQGGNASYDDRDVFFDAWGVVRVDMG